MNRIFLKIFSVAVILTAILYRLPAQDTRAYEARVASLEKEIAILDRQISDTILTAYILPRGR